MRCSFFDPGAGIGLTAKKAKEIKACRERNSKHINRSKKKSCDRYACDDKSVRQSAECADNTEHKQNNRVDNGNKVEGVALCVISLTLCKDRFTLCNYRPCVIIVAVNKLLIAKGACCCKWLIHYPVNYILCFKFKAVAYFFSHILSQVIIADKLDLVCVFVHLVLIAR